MARGLDDDAAVDLLAGAVAIPSPSRREAEVAAFLADRLERVADAVAIDAAGNVVATFGSGPFGLTMLGHVDTAPGFPPVRREADVVWGRGAVDAKGPLCAMAVAASRAAGPVRDALSIRLIGAVEEEASGSRGARFALSAYDRPDAVLIAEPSGWDAMTLGYKGRLRAVVRARRPSGHSARTEATAPAAVARAWDAIERWAGGRTAGDGAFGSVQATLAAIASRDDGIEQRARAAIGVRLPPELAPEAAAAELRRLVDALGSELGVELHLATDGFETAYRGPRDTVLTRAFRRAIRAEGGAPRTLLKTGTSDMNVVAPVWDVPMLAYGPGDSALDHTPDERLDVGEYLRSIRIVGGALDALARTRAATAADAAGLSG